MNLFFAHTWLLGELGKPGHRQKSFPKLMVVGLDLGGWKDQGWAAWLITPLTNLG